MRRDDLAKLQQHRSVMQAILDQAERDQRDLTPAEQTEFDEHQVAAEPLVLEWRRSQRNGNEPRDVREFREAGKREPSSFEEFRSRSRGPRPQDDPQYRNVFWRWLTASPDATDHEDVAELRSLSKLSGAVGLYLTPTDFYDSVVRSLRFMGAYGRGYAESVSRPHRKEIRWLRRIHEDESGQRLLPRRGVRLRRRSRPSLPRLTTWDGHRRRANRPTEFSAHAQGRRRPLVQRAPDL